MEKEYKNDFEKFLIHTNEKQILLEEITKNIQKFDVKSLLDIGAGNGLLSIPLSKKVQRYVAIESREIFVEKLKSVGLDVIHSNFPISLPEKFDMILSSHSLPYSKEKFEPFVRKAFAALNPGRIFLIVTFRGKEDDWTNLLGFLNKKERADRNKILFNTIIELLDTFGTVTLSKVVTQVTTATLDDMIQALSFVFSDGKPEKKEEFLSYGIKLEKLLNSKYKTKNGYTFPFQHFFIRTKKRA